MKFLADECCDADLVEALRTDGHDVRYVMETMRGASDTAVLRRAYDEGRIVLTEDKDFGELVYRLRRPVHGLVLLRFAADERTQKVPRVQRFVKRKANRKEASSYWKPTKRVFGRCRSHCDNGKLRRSNG